MIRCNCSKCFDPVAINDAKEFATIVFQKKYDQNRKNGMPDIDALQDAFKHKQYALEYDAEERLLKNHPEIEEELLKGGEDATVDKT